MDETDSNRDGLEVNHENAAQNGVQIGDVYQGIFWLYVVVTLFIVVMVVVSVAGYRMRRRGSEAETDDSDSAARKANAKPPGEGLWNEPSAHWKDREDFVAI